MPIRHGRVTQVTIDLATGDGTLTLSVQDNGRGFDERNASNGMGMKLMRYRAQMLGGDVTIENNQGGGVIVRCACPHRAPLGSDATPRGGFPASGLKAELIAGLKSHCFSSNYRESYVGRGLTLRSIAV